MTTTNTLQAYAEHAVAIHDTGANCAQSVARAFAADIGADENTIHRLLEGFGGGFASYGDMACGALSGAVAVIGYANAHDADQPTNKQESYKLVREATALFKEKTGHLNCGDIIAERHPQGLDCADIVRAGAEVAVTMLSRIAEQSAAAAPEPQAPKHTFTRAKVVEKHRDPLIRAANEDDDGYDPYQDYMDPGHVNYGEAPSADPWR